MGLLFGPSKTELQQEINELEDEKQDIKRRGLRDSRRYTNAIELIAETLPEVQYYTHEGKAIELDSPHVAYKATNSGIVTLVIPSGATVVVPFLEEATGLGKPWRKMRTDKAIVARIEHFEDGWSVGGEHRYDEGFALGELTKDESVLYSVFEYEVGRTVEPKFDLNKDVTEDCESGIHFFRSRDEAIEWFRN